jgi:hypothetical protein
MMKKTYKVDLNQTSRLLYSLYSKNGLLPAKFLQLSAARESNNNPSEAWLRKLFCKIPEE